MDLVSFWLVIASLILFVLYAILISYYHRGWKKIEEPDLDNAPSGTVPVTVIIPARNEELNIQACLQSLAVQTYPKQYLEIIVVDDHSTDNTPNIVNDFPSENVRLISLKEYVTGNLNSYKKKAIEVAVSESSGNWIITTDADCVADPDWIQTMLKYKELTGAELIAAPVKLRPRNKLVEIFQTLDFLTLQGITGAAVRYRFHNMCNGANLGYSKMAFNAVDGFSDIDDLASGDDMFLMHKIAMAFPDKIHYLKNKKAIVSSATVRSWKEFWQQRIRWASKAGRYKDKRMERVLILVYLFNFSLLGLFILSYWNTDALIVVILLMLCKTIVEFPFVNNIAAFFGQHRLMFYFPFLQPLHIGYVVIAGFLGKFGKYEWKGRRVK